MKKILTALAVIATLAAAAPASARDCDCNTQRGRSPLTSADANIGGRIGLVDVDANVGGRNNHGRRGGGLVDLDANVGGRNGLVDLNVDVARSGRHGGLLNLDANVGGRRNSLIDIDANILGGGVGH
jgi:hypothetical protein